MEQEMKMQDVFELLLYIASLVGIYVRLQVKMKEQEMKIISLEQRLTRAEQEDLNLYRKFDEIMKVLTEIKIDLTQKQDRQ